MNKKLNLQMFAEKPEEKPESQEKQESLEQEAQESPEQQEKEEEQGTEEKHSPKPSSSENGYATKEEMSELMNLVKLHGETVKTGHDVLTKVREELRETQEELSQTTELLQTVISQKDEALEKLIKAETVLNLMHQEQMRKLKAD